MRVTIRRAVVAFLCCWLVLLASHLLRAAYVDGRPGRLFPPLFTGTGIAVSDAVLWLAVQGCGAWLAWRVSLEGPRWLRGIILLIFAAAALVILRLGASEAIARLTGLPVRPRGPELLPVIAAQTRLALVAIASGYAVRYFVRLEQSRERAARLESQLSVAELHCLRAQLNPHFLFNALNSITALLHRDPAQASAALRRLSGLFAVTLQGDHAQLTTLDDELAFNRAYLALEALRYQERLQVEIEIDPQVGPARVPTLVLQPLVENAVRHAVGRSDRPVTLRIRAFRDVDRLRVVVEDDGPGLADVHPAGLGLANTQRRLEVIYGDRQRLTIGPRPGGGVRAELDIPLEVR